MRSTTVRRAALIGLLTMATCAPAAQADDDPAAAAAAPAAGGGGTPVATMTAPAAPAADTTTAAAPKVSETQTVKLTRAQTKSVQRRAKVKADGSLGSRTRKALKRYQAKKRLVPTGKPNLQTLKAMKLAFAVKIEQQLVAKQRSAQPVQSSVAGYVFPIQGPWQWGGVNTHFGDRGGEHEGIDLFAECGTPLVAASSGTVKERKFQSAAGNYLVITGTPSGEDQVYAHLKTPSPLSIGDAVTAGSPVGVVGDTGNADGCHLHFELWTTGGWYSGGHPRDARKDLISWGGVPSSTR
ncbi:peptidoglycan DD-metalloendopeptidase family protein [Patulibacter sp. NPDC049589]|uniref:M23 family metallopeptidase n=1 Tax=Patulibacter sp. NPDC049589 TaxID=3154731 RepID=UPI0034462578